MGSSLFSPTLGSPACLPLQDSQCSHQLQSCPGCVCEVGTDHVCQAWRWKRLNICLTLYLANLSVPM